MVIIGRRVRVPRGSDAWRQCITENDSPARGSIHAASHSNSKTAMSKRQLIDDIRRYNATAQPEFLAQFDETALKQYLEHLEEARHKHVRTATFIRRGPKLRLVS